MKYQKNSSFEFLDIDEENLAVYDPESGDTHYIDVTGKAILSFLDEATDETELVASLCTLYEAAPEEIAGDVHEFLDELLAKGVVIAL